MEILPLSKWQMADYQRLVSLNTNLPHALLLHGVAGLGKRALALNWVAGLLCSAISNGEACKQCSSCLMLADGFHPDLLYLSGDDPENEDKKTKTIGVDKTAKVSEFLALSRHMSDHKIVFIEDVSLLNIASANSLLKILEEPPRYALFVLISDNLSRVLPTIVSRCHKFKLTVQGFKSGSDQDLWLEYYGGAPLYEEEFNLEQFELLIKTVSAPSIGAIYELTKVVDGKSISFAAFTNFMIKWVSDLLLYRETATTNYFSAYQDNLRAIVERVNIERAFSLSDWLNFVSNWTNHPLNYKLQIENILFKYQQIFAK